MYLILGLARSGRSFASFCQKNNLPFCVFDDNVDLKEEAQQKGFLVWDENTYPIKTIKTIVVSPGVPFSYPKPHDLIQRAKELGIPIHTDCSLFKEMFPATYIGITGTNGKSTTTALIHHILKSSGYNAEMGGNIGIPIFDLPTDASFYVIELSSFQLERSPSLSLDVAVWINFSEDHLAQHGTIDAYQREKERIFENAKNCVIGLDDSVSNSIYHSLKKKNQKVIGISLGDSSIFELTNANLEGDHNKQNAIIAYQTLKALKIPHEFIVQGLNSFPGLKHRQQLIAKHGKITIINDSKATNADATAYALKRFSNIYWLLGGKDKSDGILPLVPYFDKINKAYLFGQARHRFSHDLEIYNKECFIFETMEDAFKKALEDAATDNSESVILLSPACASFDQFKDFEHRGDSFIEIVNAVLSHHE